MPIIKRVISSTLPIIIKTININLFLIVKLAKFISPILYIEELTVFINVKIPSLNESSKFTLDKVSNDEIMKRDKIKTKIERNYLLISDWSILDPEKIHLFV